VDDPAEYLKRIQSSRVFRVMDERVNEVREEARKLQEMNARALQRQREQYERRLSQITEDKRRAVETADRDMYMSLEQEESRLRETMPRESTPQQSTQVDPELQSYMATEQGQWLKNPGLAHAAYQFIEDNPGFKAADARTQLRAVELHVRQKYPGFFEEQKPQRQMVDPGGLGGGRGSGGQFSKLPASAKEAFARYLKAGTFKDTKADREEYAREYFGA
jgi:hypothetical protein